MNRLKRMLLAACALSSEACFAEPSAADQLADLTAKNVAMASSALATHQKGVNDVARTRAALIVSVNRLAINANQEVDRELAILNQTGGEEIAKVFEALCKHGDAAALVLSQNDAAEAAAEADVAGAYAPLAIATDKLDRAAKTLASLAKQPSPQERAKYLLQFAKDIRDESAKLAKDSDGKKTEADQKLKGSVQTASATVAKSSSK